MSGPGRRPLAPIAAANWKMHFVRAEARAYCRELLADLPALRQTPAEVVIFPSSPLLAEVAQALEGSPVAWGAQNLHPDDKGAHTGEVSGPQLADLGCRWVLCGHSERRREIGEGDELVGRKVAAAERHGLLPLLCVGESREERQAGATFEVLGRQLAAGLAGRPERFAVAYEPVWAIGSGETATPETANEAQAYLRRRLAELCGEGAAAACRILYGGSVTPETAPELFAQPEIDGFLVGGASLDPGRFLAIIRACGSH